MNATTFPPAAYSFARRYEHALRNAAQVHGGTEADVKAVMGQILMEYDLELLSDSNGWPDSTIRKSADIRLRAYLEQAARDGTRAKDGGVVEAEGLGRGTLG